jgi:phage-related protein
MKFKPLVWLGDSIEHVRGFADDARRRVGFELWEVQRGSEPSDSKPMPSVGLGVKEIRVHINGAYRTIYVAGFPEAVYVLHAFEKKSRKTAKEDLALARDRFKELVRERKQS